MTKNLDNDLDKLLRSQRDVKAPNHLRQSVFAQMPQPLKNNFSWIWPFGSLWQPFGLMGGALALGLFMGVLINIQNNSEPTWSDVEYLVMGDFE